MSDGIMSSNEIRITPKMHVSGSDVSTDMSSDTNFTPKFGSDSTSVSPDIQSEQINLPISLDGEPKFQATFDLVGSGGAVNKIHYATKAEWNSHPLLIAERGHIYSYSDYKTDDQGKNIAGLKVGDGSSYLIDMPFIDELYANHINDVVVHITQEEREFWNNKVRCYEVDEHTLVFTTH